jgi:hypothetical protein
MTGKDHQETEMNRQWLITPSPSAGPGHGSGANGRNAPAVEWHQHAPTDRVPEALKRWHRGVTGYDRVNGARQQPLSHMRVLKHLN